MKFQKKLSAISLGQGQGPRAEAMMKQAMDRGRWVFFQNCHLSPSWMPTLERLIEQIDADKVHTALKLIQSVIHLFLLIPCSIVKMLWICFYGRCNFWLCVLYKPLVIQNPSLFQTYMGHAWLSVQINRVDLISWVVCTIIIKHILGHFEVSLKYYNTGVSTFQGFGLEWFHYRAPAPCISLSR